MYRVISCLGTQHDPWLVILAAIVCVSTTLTAFKLYSIAAAHRDRQQFVWLGLTGVCAGAGIWATHFVAMLAYDGGFPTAYEPVGTLASLLLAIVVAAAGFFVSLMRGKWPIALGGMLVGAAIGSMHYLGMSALVVPGTIDWDFTLVAASWFFSLFFGPISLLAFHRYSGARAMYASAALLTVGICGLHFISMGGAIILPDPTIVFQASAVSRPLMALGVSGVTFVVLLSGLAAAVIQKTNVRCEAVLREHLAQLNMANAELDLKAMELDRCNEHLEVAINSMGRGLSMFDAQKRLVVCNKSYATIYGLPKALTQPGTHFVDIMRCLPNAAEESDGRELTETELSWLKELNACMALKKRFSQVQKLRDGRTLVVTFQPLAHGGWVDTQEDVTERLAQEAKIYHMAHHDALTGLPNRVSLHEHLEDLIGGARGQRQFAIHFLDLDGFKGVNDTLGHGAGDDLLKQVSKRLKDCVRPGDFVARLGGDEFAIVQAETYKAAQAQNLATRMIDALSKPYDIQGHQATVGTSIGIALSPHDGSDAEKLLKHADLALYMSKKSGRRRSSFYNPALSDEAQTRHNLEKDLRAALDAGQFELFYQPLISADSGDLRGFEALLRWRHPERGLVSPVEFIPLAEETGLIVPIGAWVLRQACVQAQAWPKHLKMAVNVSAFQLKQPGFAETVIMALADSGHSPDRLELEITEWALIDSSSAVHEILRKLHDVGVHLALDDFGTGYSSLNYLRILPVDKIKIDRSFIHDLQSGAKNALALMQSIANIGHSLGLTICAEGVETQEQRDITLAEGCTEMQGYYFSQPLAVVDIERRYFAQSKQSPRVA